MVTGFALAAEERPERGEWRGETEQGRRVVFDVEKSGSKLEVNEFNTDSRFKCSNGETRLGSFYNLSATIKEGKFSIERSNPPSIPPWRQVVKGTFDSKRHAKGTVRGSFVGPADPLDQLRGHQGALVGEMGITPSDVCATIVR